MDGEQVWVLTAAGGAIALSLLVVVALLWRTTRRLAARIGRLEDERRTRRVADAATYVITAIDEVERTPTATVQARVDRALFADIVARESVIKAAGLAHGLRRALSAENRNRIRFEVRREVRRARKQRRTDSKVALRDQHERGRARSVEGRAGEDAA